MKNTIFIFLFCFFFLSFYGQDLVVQSHQKISDTQGGFTGILDNVDRFGQNLSHIGDIDKDGVEDIAIGAPFDDDGGTNKGAVWILFLKSDGSIKGHQKISDTQGGFTAPLSVGGVFGTGVSGIGDLDQDGVLDIAVGNEYDFNNGGDKGAFWILFLNTDGTVKAHQKIAQNMGGFTGTLSNNGKFGRDITNLYDLDGDNVNDLAVSANLDDDGGTDKGAIWVLFMNTNGTVKSHQKISDTQGNFTGMLSNVCRFGTAVERIGDLDKDGIQDLAVSAVWDDGNAIDAGAIWILFLNSNGTVKEHKKIEHFTGTFTTEPGANDNIGTSMAAMGDLDQDGTYELEIGGWRDDDGGTNKGAVWIISLNSDGTVKCTWKISELHGNFTGTLSADDVFGVGVSFLGDLDGDGFPSIAIGARGDDDGGTDRGAVWMMELQYTDYSDILGQDTIICFDGTYLIDATVPNNATYHWQDGSTQPTFFTGVSGWYWVDITLANGCTLRDSVHVFFTQGPNVEFGSDTIFLQAGTSIMLDAGTSGTNYLWNTGDTSQTITVTQSGTYHVVVSNASGCSDEDEVVVIVLTNTKKVFDGIDFNLYPNPTLQAITIDFENKKKLSYQIVDNLGRVLETGTISDSSKIIEIEQLNPGIYFFQIMENNISVGIKQFVKL